MFDVQYFAKMLQKARKEQGMTQSELADRLLVSSQSVSYWECGKGMPDIAHLCEIADILGMNDNHTVVILGAGNLGRALIENFPFRSSGFRLIAAFDVDPVLVGTRLGGVPVYHIDMLENYMKERAVNVAVLTVPAAVAKDSAATVMACGVEGIWNFTNVELPKSGHEDVKIENVHFADSLLTLSYMISEERV